MDEISLNLLPVLLCIALVLGIAGVASGQHMISVAGIVVDDKGNPVEGASVGFHHGSSECLGCHDQVVASYRTGKNGVFFLDDELESTCGWLFIETPVSSEFWNLVSAPDVGLPLRKFSEFKGMPIRRPESGALVNLGKIEANVVYVPFSIDLTRLFQVEKEGLKNLSTLKLSVIYKGVSVWNKLIIPEKYVDQSIGVIRLALPVGRWKLNIFAVKKRPKEELLERGVIVDLTGKIGNLEYMKSSQ